MVLAASTLGPSPGARLARAVAWAHERDVLPWAASYGMAEAGASVLLFVPIAFLLCLELPAVPRRLLWLGCVILSVGIETVQGALPDRETTFRDVLTNATGAVVGVLLAWLVDLVRSRRAAG